jgi:hypothetical protein
MPKPGEVVFVDAAASCQFSGDRALVLRVIRVHDWSTYDGWAWLDGYVLNAGGEAVDRRTVYVRHDGLRPGRPTPPVSRRPSSAGRAARGGRASSAACSGAPIPDQEGTS